MEHSNINYASDVKVLGRVVSISTDNKIAEAEQVFDTPFKYDENIDYPQISETKVGLNQYDINRLLKRKVWLMDKAGLVPYNGVLNIIKPVNISANFTVNGHNVTNELTQLDDRVDDLENDITGVENELSVLKGRVTAIEGGNSSIIGRLAAAEDNIRNLSNTVNTHSSDISNLKTRVSALESWRDSINTWKSGIDSWKNSVNANLATLNSCCEEVRGIINNIPTGGGGAASFTVSPKNVVLTEGETQQLTLSKGADLTGSFQFGGYSNIITVSPSGLITALSAGSTTITVSVSGYGVTQEVAVTVNRRTVSPTSVAISGPESIKVGQTGTYTATITPANADTDTALTWSVISGGGSITSNGVYTAPSTVGTATIQVSTANNKTATKQINIYTEYATVGFDKNDGSDISYVTVEIGHKVARPADPERSGYLFGGWYNGNNLWNFNDVVNNSMTLTAHWTREVVAPQSVSIVGPDEVEVGTTVTYTGTISPSNASAYTDLTWEISSGSGNINAHTGVYTAPASVTNGEEYIEVKVTTENGISQYKRVRVYQPQAPVTYVTVTFDTDGGTPAIADQTIPAGTTITKPADPIKQGHDFQGWRQTTAVNGYEAGHVWSFSDPVNANMTLKAYWSETGETPVVVSDIQIFGPNSVKMSEWYSDNVHGAVQNVATFTAQVNEGANTGTTLTWSIDDNTNDRYGTIAGVAGVTTTAYYHSPYAPYNINGIGDQGNYIIDHYDNEGNPVYLYMLDAPNGNLMRPADPVMITIRVTSENGTTATKQVQLYDDAPTVPEPETYTVSWTCTYNGGSGVGHVSVNSETEGTAQVEPGQNWTGSVLTEYAAGTTITINGEVSNNYPIQLNNIHRDYEIVVACVDDRLSVTVKGDHAQVQDYNVNGGTWLNTDTDRYLIYDTSNMGNRIVVGSDVTANIRPASGYKITKVEFSYDGEAADENSLLTSLDQINENFGQFHIGNIKSDATVTITTEAA